MNFSHRTPRTGAINTVYALLIGAVIILAVLSVLLFDLSSPTKSESGASLMLYCAAGLRAPAEQIVADYEREYKVPIQVQFGGSNTLLSQIEVGKMGDLFLAADDSYTDMARKKGLVAEAIPVAQQRPVIAVKKGNPKNIHSVDDLLRPDVVTALGSPDQAAVGKAARSLLMESGQWDPLEKAVTERGVFKPTVPEVANDVKIGAVDAGIVWDSTMPLYPDLEAVRTPELDQGTASIMLGVLSRSTHPTEALRFARYLTARDQGQQVFGEKGFDVTVAGDKWEESPELTFFCGSVNRRAVESVIDEFQKREGVVVNAVYNGCGILTAQMRTMIDQPEHLGFPDTYMACDVYYLKTVADLFQDAVNVSDTEVVIAVPKGNPAGIKDLDDLTRPGMRISVGQPDQCTIGVLTRQLLEAEGVYDALMKNVVKETASSALLVPDVITGHVDAALAYATDTRAEQDKLDVIRIDSPAAKAIQPISISRSSDHKQLARRLHQAVLEAKSSFEAAGFHWRLDEPSSVAGTKE